MGTAIVLIGLLIVVALVVVSIYRDKKKPSGCCGSCVGCTGCATSDKES